jgi:plastocyanin
VKKLGLFFVLLTLLTVCFAGCAFGGGDDQNSPDSIHLDTSSFTQGSITISKGSSITLINNTDTAHNIANGTWDFNTANPQEEVGAPPTTGLSFSSANETHVLGPFNTSGTYHFYCTIHPGMAFIVIVQ